MQKKLKKYQLKLNELLTKDKYSFNNELKDKIPTVSGLYRIFDNNSSNTESLYLGISKNLQKRIVNNHYKGTIRNSTLRKKLSRIYATNEITKFFSEKCSVQFIEINIDELHCYEHFFIAILCPKLND